jgi:hypothetical protein
LRAAAAARLPLALCAGAHLHSAHALHASLPRSMFNLSALDELDRPAGARSVAHARSDLRAALAPALVC